jgi:putative chitinase
MTHAQLVAFLPSLHTPDVWLAALNDAFARYEVNTPTRQAAFLAQTAHESAEFAVLVENLNYSAPALLRTWPKRFPDPATAALYANQPERIANYVYAGRLGNGPVESGDGWRFRGRGLLQVTGRANYAACGLNLGLPLEDAPDRLAVPPVAVLAAADFWKSHHLNSLVDANTDAAFLDITKVINGGVTGLDSRRCYWQRAQAALA